MSAEFISAHIKQETLRQKAYHHQLLFPSNIGSNNIATQRSVMLNTVNLTMLNPFINDAIDEELWLEYQNYISLVYNFKPLNESSSLDEKRERLKKQLALNILSSFMSENVIIPAEESEQLSKYLANNSITKKSIIFKSYQKHLLDINTQLQTKIGNEKTLHIIHNIQLAQRNMMLNELRKLKIAKNEMSSLLVI